MKRSISVMFAVAISLALTSRCTAEMLSYANREYECGFLYPANWSIEPTRMSETLVKIVNPDRSLAFNYSAVRKKALLGMPPTEFVKHFSRDAIQRSYSTQFNNFVLLDAGITYLSNQLAYYIVYLCSYRSLDYEVPWKTMTIFANRSGVQYTLSIGGIPQVYDREFATLRYIITSFVISAPL